VSITSVLFKAARFSADVRSLRTPKAALRRVKNKTVGRLMARTGIWRRLWK
jgi:hypothetical protein